MKETLHPSVDFSRNVVCVMGLPFDVLTMAEAAEKVRAAARDRTRLMLSTANLNFVVAARTDPAFRDSIISGQMTLADGMPIVWVARLLGLPIAERVSGAGLFDAIRLNETDNAAVKVFFFGGPEGVAEAASVRLNGQQSSGVTCVGFDYPGYASVDTMSGEDRIEHINRTGSDFVVVSLGAKKGHAWIDRNRVSISAPVISHLGAVVNFAAGRVRRAPHWMQRSGLEWLWRVKEEPSLLKRYATDGVAFLQIVFTCVLPLWLRGLRSSFEAPQPVPSVDIQALDGCVALKLTGSFDAAHADVLRAPFTAAAEARTRLRFDLSGTSRMSSAAVALLLLLHGHQREISRPMELIGASNALRRQFGYHGADFLLGARADRHVHVAEVERSRA